MENPNAWLETLLYASLLLSVVTLVLGIVLGLKLLRGGPDGNATDLQVNFERIATMTARTETAVRDEQERLRRQTEESGRELRREVNDGILQFGTSMQATLSDSRSIVDRRFEEFARTQAEFFNSLRDELRKTISTFGETLKADVKAVAEANGMAQEALRQTVTERLDRLRADNEARLEAMRATVEEKLQGTLEKRLGESFALVSDRLELVHKGLGEMQTLAIGVGDLKRVMSNVKDRGGWAEVQLGAMLEQMLARDQYLTNAKMDPSSGEVVEYAVRMPGQVNGAEVLLPIDAKFPKEDYERLALAWESGNAEAARAASEALAAVFETEARRISTKYVRPPLTTDFAVMYVPTEGLFAEAMRTPGLAQRLQSKHRVTVAGPTTLHALLNSLQMGFRTLAIQKRSGEVWRVLTEAKAEFQKYAEVWDRLSKQLQTAQNTIQEAGKRTRAVERKLKDVELGDGVPIPLLDVDTPTSEPE